MSDKYNVRRMNKYPVKVRDRVKELINQGVEFRYQDSNHLLLYPLEGRDTMRISSSRPAEQTLDYLDRWVARHVTPTLMERQMRQQEIEVVAVVEQVQDAIENTLPPGYVDVPDDILSGEEEPVEWTPLIEGYEPPPGWDWYTIAPGRANERKSRVFITDGKVYTCTVCAAVFDQIHSIGGHTRQHTADSPLTDEVRALSNTPEARAQANETLRKTNIKRWLGRIAEECGVDLTDPNDGKRIRRLEAQVEDLEARLAKAEEERDNIQAKFDMAKEVFGL